MCSFFSVCFSNFHLSAAKRTNKSIKQRNKQVMITGTKRMPIEQLLLTLVTIMLKMYLCIGINRGLLLRSSFFSSIYTHMDTHTHEHKEISVCIEYVLSLWFLFACVSTHIFPITWQWHWKNSRVDFDILVISWWHH